MKYFVQENSIVREIWKNTDTVLLIFAGSAAEFALNKAVDWLYFTGKIPNNPLERLFSTVAFAQKIVFSENETALQTINEINKIHQNVEKSRGKSIPDWAYRDVLYMLIDYSIRSFELLERKLNQQEKEELFDVFKRVGNQMQLKNLPKNYESWIIDRKKHLENDIEKGAYTIHLFEQYKKHLGRFRYYIVIEIQKKLVPKQVFHHLYTNNYFLGNLLIGMYKFSKKVHLDLILKKIILPKKHITELIAIGKFENL